MYTERSHSSADRDDALRRLRTMTVATGLAGAAAVVTLGGVAAISNPGHQATPVSAVAGDSTGSSSTSAQATAPTLQAPAQLPFAVFGGGQTTTGGS